MARAVGLSMSSPTREPTPYPYVNEVLHALLMNVQAILGERFGGLYLYGSLASGGFNPRRSDIDFMVMTEGRLPEATITKLEQMHTKLWASGGKWAGKLEGAYVPRELLRRVEPNGPEVPQINEGKFFLAPLGSDWVIQVHILREYSAPVVGPSLRELIEPVSPEALRGAVVKVLDEWWAPMLANHHWLERSEYQAYAVLTMCRALYTLQEGKFVSKTEAAGWARGALDERWRRLIDWADGWPEEQSNRLEEVLELVRYTLGVSRAI